VPLAVGGVAADLRRVGLFSEAMILAPVQVALAAVAARDGVGGPAGQQLVQLRPAAQFPQAAAPGSARDHGGEPVHDPAQHWRQLGPAKVGGQQPDPQAMSNPTPPGEITPPRAVSVAATPPIGN